MPKLSQSQLRAPGRAVDDWIVDGFAVLLSSIVLLVVAYPLWFIIVSSVSDPNAVVLGQVTFYPRGFTLEGYERIFEYRPIWIGYRNTLFYTTAGTTLNLALTLSAAYALSRKEMPARTLVTFIFALTMFFNGGLIPTYMVYRQLGLLNTVWVMLIPGAISMWNTVICRTFFQNSIPAELQQSAVIDGCSDFGVFFRIVLPLSKPIIAVMALFYGVVHWNAFFNALIYLSRFELFPLQLFLRNILIQGQMFDMLAVSGDEEMMRYLLEQLQLAEAMKFGIIIVSSIPFLIAYPFLQKYFVKGVMIGAIKG